MKRAARWAAGLVGATLVLGLAIHLPIIRHWMAAHGHHGGGMCPLGYGREQVAHAQTHHTAQPALGFVLGVTTAADIGEWASANGTACETTQHGGSIACANVPASLGAWAVWFQLDSGGTVTSITSTHRAHDVEPVATAFERLQQDLTARVGAPAKRDGSAAPEVLANGALRQAMIEYRTADYRAVVRATNMGDGFMLSEHYALVERI